MKQEGKNLVPDNIFLVKTEREELAEAVIKKYGQNDGFNTTRANYSGLIESIKSMVRNAKVSASPLGKLLYTYRRFNDAKTFRRSFVETMYAYAHSCSRDQYLKDHQFAADLIKTIAGYWDCYYDPDNQFFTDFAKTKKGILRKMEVFISSESNNPVAWTSCGKGQVSIHEKYVQLYFPDAIVHSRPSMLLCNFIQAKRPPLVKEEYATGVLLVNSIYGSQDACRFFMTYRPDKKVDEYSPSRLQCDLIKVENQDNLSELEKNLKRFFCYDHLNMISSRIGEGGTTIAD